MTRENPFVPIYKACNNGTNEEKYDLIKKGIVTVPRYIDVEPTNCCNFSCRFCPTGTHSLKRTKGYMSDEVVDRLVENVAKYKIEGVRFSRWGEPTFHPKFVEIVKKFKATGTLVHFNNNGSILTDEQMAELIDAGLDSIKFSFQGATEGTYNEMRHGGDYANLLRRIHKFHELRGDRALPYIQISTSITGETAEDVELFKADVADYCDYYNVGYTQLSHINVDAMNIPEEEKQKIRELKEQESLEKVRRQVCAEVYDKLSFNWNGDATLCCADYDNFMIIGNIMDMDMKQLFNSYAANQYRDIITKGQLGRIECCANCFDRIQLQK